MAPGERATRFGGSLFPGAVPPPRPAVAALPRQALSPLAAEVSRGRALRARRLKRLPLAQLYQLSPLWPFRPEPDSTCCSRVCFGCSCTTVAARLTQAPRRRKLPILYRINDIDLAPSLCDLGDKHAGRPQKLSATLAFQLCKEPSSSAFSKEDRNHGINGDKPSILLCLIPPSALVY
jgi:hypothetical protein